MSQSGRLERAKILSKRGYPLPQVHHSEVIGPEQQQQPQQEQVGGRGSCKHKIAIGVNAQTGRVQWCPDVKCCKFLVVLPVVMLPVALVLILLMRMDGILTSLQMQARQQQQQPTPSGEVLPAQEALVYSNDYEGDLLQDIVNEQLMLPYEQQLKQQHLQELSEEDRIKRCLSFKFGLSETMEQEDRDIMRDARTSFLPQDTTIIPRECLEKISYGGHWSTAENYDPSEEYFRRRLRRTSNNENPFIDAANESVVVALEENIDSNSASNGEPEADNDDTSTSEDGSLDTEDDASLIDPATGMQTFWNEQGTKMSIRQAQAKTMKKYMDTTVSPCTDFYKYACGNWEKMHPIPKDKAGFDTFEMLRESLDMVLKQLLESRDHDDQKRGVSAPVNDNSYQAAPVPNMKADIVDTQVQQQQTAAKAARLRRHIVSRRNVLSRILLRYRRQTITGTKRKRFIPFFSSSSSTSSHSNSEGNSALHAHPAIPVSTKISNENAQLKAKHLYQSCINTQLLQKRGIQPLLQLIESLGGWPVLNAHWNANKFDWLNLTAQLRRYNNDILIVQWVGPDIKNSDENVIQFDQTSLGLPTREYFLQDMNSKYLQAYQRFMTEVMQKLGASEDAALRNADELINFETHLAQITSPAEMRLNVTKLYKRMTLRQLHNTVPEINWLRYLSILQKRTVRDTEQVVIYAIDYMQDLVALLAETEPRIVANYLMWRFVRHRINNVDNRFEGTKQNFYHALFGREESPSRWKVCIAQVNTNMGMALGSMFVTKYFDENSKRDTLKMTHELQQAFREILTTTDWLDRGTKHLAELKVNAMSLKIGYPDFILNPAELNEKYVGIDINPDRYFENTLNVLLHTAKTEQNKLHEPVNKTTWQTAPAIVNAYYSRNKNQIMFPAGILQPPFYHRYFPRSLNFGGIGVVIGHELTHGFDDKGRLFDRNGSIHKWWSDTAIKGFDERARCIIAQYSNYTVGEVGISLNGESTQGENIADNGGIRQAFHAYKRWMQNNPEAARDERLPGINMTGAQLFFLNFGQVWCGAMRPEAVRNKLNTAIHSPGRFRVIGTLSNSKDFAHEFHCPLGSPMNPTHKCSVW